VIAVTNCAPPVAVPTLKPMSPAPVKVGAEVQTISIEVIIELFG